MAAGVEAFIDRLAAFRAAAVGRKAVQGIPASFAQDIGFGRNQWGDARHPVLCYTCCPRVVRTVLFWSAERETSFVHLRGRDRLFSRELQASRAVRRAGEPALRVAAVRRGHEATNFRARDNQ